VWGRMPCGGARRAPLRGWTPCVDARRAGAHAVRGRMPCAPTGLDAMRGRTPCVGARRAGAHAVRPYKDGQMTFSGVGALRALRAYGNHLRLFRPNARLYLLNVVVTGTAFGVFRLLFNFFVLSQGYDEALLGSLVTASSLTALIVALPMGYLADLLGRKRSLISSGTVVGMAVAIMVLRPVPAVLYAMNILLGAAQSLAGVTMSPFLMENSSERERTYLFSFSSGLQMASASVGNWIGGSLPGWVAGWWGVDPMSSAAYGGSLLIVAGVASLGLIPLFLLRTPRLERSQRSVFAPLSYATANPTLLSKLVLPMLITSIGAGMIMPFMNIFFRQVHGQPDPSIGALFAWGSLSMGVGLFIAPPLADRVGKIRLVVITQALSIPFLILLGFAPWFWVSTMAYLVRVALMNMSAPVYQTFVMENVEPSARATVASLVSMSWNFGWAFSPTVSGLLQVRYGFGPPFMVTIVLYSLSTYLYWAFFGRQRVVQPTAEAPVASPPGQP
ncbi:MAG: MFS transporter, partial [Anaerolineae bacterium]